MVVGDDTVIGVTLAGILEVQEHRNCFLERQRRR
jgi:hypothetical protein